MPPRPRQRKQPRIALATCAAHPRLAPDDRLLATAIAARGIEAVPVVWNAEGTDWARFDACVVRSVWDYHLESDRFLAWAERVAGTVPTWNPAELIAWNADKAYLRQLEQRGVPTIPTRWLERGSEARLAEILGAEDWDRAVIKPAVDLGAKNLRRVGGGGAADQEALDGLLARHDVMVQPFLPSLEERGELSLVYCGGEFSHAVRKLPASGDFRVQPSWGGSSRAADAGPDDLELGRRALAGLATSPLYARVDLVAGPRGERLLIELELIDPNLFFATRPEAAATIAAEIAASLSR